jgi:hypothetical protein
VSRDFVFHVVVADEEMDLRFPGGGDNTVEELGEETVVAWVGGGADVEGVAEEEG